MYAAVELYIVSYYALLTFEQVVTPMTGSVAARLEDLSFMTTNALLNRSRPSKWSRSLVIASPPGSRTLAS